MKFEIWSIGKRDINFYTTNPLIGRIIKQMFSRITTYERNGNIFAWQCTMPETKLNFVEMQIKKKFEVENQQLTRVGKAKFRFKDRDSIRQSFGSNHLIINADGEKNEELNKT